MELHLGRAQLKVKTAKRQEAVIVGFTAPRRTRPRFGALVLAVREGQDWHYVGHVGTGFSHAMLEKLYAKMAPLRATKSPFKQRVKDEALTTWVKPKLVAEVKFTRGPAAARCAIQRSWVCRKTRSQWMLFSRRNCIAAHETSSSHH